MTTSIKLWNEPDDLFPPVDPGFLRRMREPGVLEAADAPAVHGFPLGWEGSSYFRRFRIGLLRRRRVPRRARDELSPELGICAR